MASKKKANKGIDVTLVTTVGVVVLVLLGIALWWYMDQDDSRQDIDRRISNTSPLPPGMSTAEIEAIIENTSALPRTNGKVEEERMRSIRNTSPLPTN